MPSIFDKISYGDRSYWRSWGVDVVPLEHDFGYKPNVKDIAFISSVEGYEPSNKGLGIKVLQRVLEELFVIQEEEGRERDSQRFL